MYLYEILLMQRQYFAKTAEINQNFYLKTLEKIAESALPEPVWIELKAAEIGRIARKYAKK